MATKFVVAWMVIGIAAGCVTDGDDNEQVEVEASGLTTPQLLYTQSWAYTGKPFGQSYNIPFGGPCTPGRERSHAIVERVSGTGQCAFAGWLTTNQFDCAASLHVGAAWNEGGLCMMRVYEQPANVVIFEHAFHNGASKRFDPGIYDVNALGIPNDSLSSLKVPPGWTVTLFEHGGFTGRIQTYTAGTNYVGNDFNDVTSSLVVVRAPGSPN